MAEIDEEEAAWRPPGGIQPLLHIEPFERWPTANGHQLVGEHESGDSNDSNPVTTVR